MYFSKRWAAAIILVVATAWVWDLLHVRSSAARQQAAEQTRPVSSPTFTPAHRTALDAVKEFFSLLPAPVQPIAFTHQAHLANRLQCTDCHTGVEKGPEAGLPSVKLCMTCHSVIATDRPEIKKVAAYLTRGEEISWQRVYSFSPSAHLKFNHAPHIRAKVACASCHGDMTQQTVAVRSVDLNMGFCINCHKLRKVSIDCTTCHF